MSTHHSSTGEGGSERRPRGRLVRVDPARPDPAAIAQAAALLREGELVAFPTETVYGLGAHALDAAAVRRIYEAKGRPGYNPLIVHVASTEEARAVAREWPERAARLAAAFWPGPLTLVLPRRAAVPDAVTAGLDTVAVRVPSHAVAQALLRAAALPVAAPSANPSMRVSPTTAEHVARWLGDRVSLVLDGGPAPVGIESTVVDLTTERPALLRPGIISAEELEPVVGPLARPARQEAEEARRSPGMLDRHYAPDARVHLFEPASRAGAEAVAMEERTRGRVVGALVRHPLAAPVAHAIAMPDEPRAYARQLYASLHALDALGCDVILVEQVPDAPAWAGVRDRLERAAR